MFFKTVLHHSLQGSVPDVVVHELLPENIETDEGRVRIGRHREIVCVQPTKIVLEQCRFFVGEIDELPFSTAPFWFHGVLEEGYVHKDISVDSEDLCSWSWTDSDFNDVAGYAVRDQRASGSFGGEGSDGGT